MKKITVLGHTSVTVSVTIEVPDNAVLTESEIYAKAVKNSAASVPTLGTVEMINSLVLRETESPSQRTSL